MTEKNTMIAARALPSNSSQSESGELINPFLQPGNSPLDPNSSDFDSKAWLQMVVGITSRDPQLYPKRVAGVAFRRLSAHGFGEPTDFQKTFGNYPLKVLSSFTKLFGRVQKTRIEILRNFDGLIRSGEMLLVLGRPGR